MFRVAAARLTLRRSWSATAIGSRLRSIFGFALYRQYA
jgi:hypothetical protein